MFRIIRAHGTDGDIIYVEETVDCGLLETTEQSIDREFQEALYRWKLQRTGIKIEEKANAQDEENEALGGEPELEDEPLN